MDHVRESQLLELAAGRLPPDEADAVMHHLHVCAACQRSLDEIRQTNDALDDWNRLTKQVDLVARVEAAIESNASNSSPRFAWWARTAGIAAMVVISIAIGHYAGRLYPRGTNEAVISLTTAEDQLQLAVLADSDRTGLSRFLDDAMDTDEAMP